MGSPNGFPQPGLVCWLGPGQAKEERRGEEPPKQWGHADAKHIRCESFSSRQIIMGIPLVRQVAPSFTKPNQSRNVNSKEPHEETKVQDLRAVVADILAPQQLY